MGPPVGGSGVVRALRLSTLCAGQWLPNLGAERISVLVAVARSAVVLRCRWPGGGSPDFSTRAVRVVRRTRVRLPRTSKAHGRGPPRLAPQTETPDDAPANARRRRRGGPRRRGPRARLQGHKAGGGTRPRPRSARALGPASPRGSDVGPRAPVTPRNRRPAPRGLRADGGARR